MTATPRPRQARWIWTRRDASAVWIMDLSSTAHLLCVGLLVTVSRRGPAYQGHWSRNAFPNDPRADDLAMCRPSSMLGYGGR